MPMADMLDLVHSLLVEEATNPMARSRHDARKVVDDWLNDNTGNLPDRETWGKLPEHQEGLLAAMGAMMGGGETVGE